MLAGLHFSLRVFKDELSKTDMAFSVAVTRTCEYFTADRPSHIGHFFRSLINKKHK